MPKKKTPVGYVYKSVYGGDNGRYFIYIGQHQATQFNPKYTGSGREISQYRKQYGKESIKTKLLQWCYSAKELKDTEQYYVAKYVKRYKDRCVNVTKGGDGILSLPGRAPHTGKTWFNNGVVTKAIDTALENIPKGFKPGVLPRAKGKAQWWNNGKSERRIPLNEKPPKGWTVGRSPSSKHTISRKTREAMTQDVCARISAAASKPKNQEIRRRPRVFSEEHLANIRKAHNDEAWRLKVSEANKGKPKSEEHKAKLRRQKRSDVAKMRMSIARTNSRFYNNGKVNLRLQEGVKPPKGFKLGMMPSKLIKCPHCNELVSVIVAKRNHFDNCKHG